MEKVLVPCVVCVTVMRIVKIVQQVGGHKAIEALEYLKAYLILPSWLKWWPTKSVIYFMVLYFATLDDTKRTPLKFVQVVAVCFFTTIPDGRTIIKQGKNHGVIQCDTSLSRDDLMSLRNLPNWDEILVEIRSIWSFQERHESSMTLRYLNS